MPKIRLRFEVVNADAILKSYDDMGSRESDSANY